MDFPWYVLALSFIIAFCAGWVDAIAGGGGLITVPFLVYLGIPQYYILATYKLQMLLGHLTSVLNFFVKGALHFKGVALGVVFIALSTALGTLLTLYLSPEILRIIVPILMCGVFIYTLLAPKVGEEDTKPKIKPALFYTVVIFILGFYDGFFGPGASSFIIFAFVTFLGLNMKKAVVRAKLMGFTSNIVSLVIFIGGGHVLWSIGLLMSAGQILGAWIGSNLVLTKKVKFIRIVFLCVAGVTILKLMLALVH
ncbi:TSUP family transporter [Helicobacter suis]|uniref:TSUP family transporter n=1 Tax=Helicobacter suis TaxID=104628 RepID=UPI0013D1AA93|nr:TSUP family transporter [Helicobacter suis]